MRKLNNYNDYPLIMINNKDISAILGVMKMVANGKADGDKYKRINFGRYTDEKFQEFSNLVLNNIDDIKEQLDKKYPSSNDYFVNSDFLDNKIQIILNDIMGAKSFSDSNDKLMKQLKKDLNKTNFNISADADDGINHEELSQLTKINSASINSVVGQYIYLDGLALDNILKQMISDWKEKQNINWNEYHIDFYGMDSEVNCNNKDKNATDAVEYTEDLQSYLIKYSKSAINGYFSAYLEDHGLNKVIELSEYNEPEASEVYCLVPVLNLKGLSLQDQLHYIDEFEKIENKYGDNEIFNDEAKHFLAVGYDDDHEEYDMY